MKLASYKDGSRDGQLLVVSRDLTSAHYATGLATRMQQLLDDWNFISPQLEDLYRTLNQGKARHAFAFDPRLCMAPLPRAYQWVNGSAFLPHLERVRRARGVPLPEKLTTEPLMFQGASDDFLGPCDDIRVPSERMGIDFEAALAVITGDVARGTGADEALAGIRLLLLANDVNLRHLMPTGLTQGVGFVQSKPATSFSPVAVTPDELGDAWRGGRVHLNLESVWNGQRVGLCNAGPEMHFHFGQLMAHLCTTRHVRAGSIVGSGAVSNQDTTRGFSCLLEKQAHETLETLEAPEPVQAVEPVETSTPQGGFMRNGDSIRIDMIGRDGQSVFGAIEQHVTTGE